jgi:hypothetical protein
MRRGEKRWYVLVGLVGWLVVSFLTVRPVAGGMYLDEGNTLFFTSVFTNQYRLRTQNPLSFNAKVGDWTMMQHRTLVDPQLMANVLPWIRNQRWGANLIEGLNIESARFFFNYRLEYEGAYDYGPKVYRDDVPPSLQKTTRQQIFEAWGDVRIFGALNIRVGRQNLSWGQTNGFRLLDQINPLDNSFGGFLLSLDERRRPLNMVRATLSLPTFPDWGIYDLAVQGFIAPDSRLPVAGAAPPTPWGTGGAPQPAESIPTLISSIGEFGAPTDTVLQRPDKSLEDSRAGVRLLMTRNDASFSLAYLSTYSDAPTVSYEFAPNGVDPVIKLRFPNVQILGMTGSMPIPGTYAVLRGEVAGFFGEPFFIEEQNFAAGKRYPKRDVIRGVIGLDHAHWIRFLNPNNTINFGFQQFYSNIQGNMDGIKAPIQEIPGRFLDVDRESFLTTFHFLTVYSAAYFKNLFQVQPIVAFFYDWEGAWLFQPNIILIRDPFRFQMQYTRIWGRFAGIGTLKDKDNLMFSFSYLM